MPAVSRSRLTDLQKRRAVSRKAARVQLGPQQRHLGVLPARGRGNPYAPQRPADHPGRPGHHFGRRNSANRDQKRATELNPMA
jgi:hypothetical protein